MKLPSLNLEAEAKEVVAVVAEMAVVLLVGNSKEIAMAVRAEVKAAAEMVDNEEKADKAVLVEIAEIVEAVQLAEVAVMVVEVLTRKEVAEMAIKEVKAVRAAKVLQEEKVGLTEKAEAIPAVEVVQDLLVNHLIKNLN